MGLQIECPLCGMSRKPDHFGARELVAKEVTSRGGNRGFDHREVQVPLDLRQQIAREVRRLHERFAGQQVQEIVGGVEESIDEALDELGDGPTKEIDLEVIEREIESEVIWEEIDLEREVIEHGIRSAVAQRFAEAGTDFSG